MQGGPPTVPALRTSARYVSLLIVQRGIMTSLHRRLVLQLIAGATVLPTLSRTVRAQGASAVATLSATGKLRVALIASNPVLVTRSPDGTLGGVSVAIARALAARLGVPLELKPYDNPARYNESLATDDWDIGLAARDPSRSEEHTSELQ